MVSNLDIAKTICLFLFKIINLLIYSDTISHVTGSAKDSLLETSKNTLPQLKHGNQGRQTTLICLIMFLSVSL